MEGVTQPTSFDLPFFTISSHELYGVASKLIQSDGDKRFLERIFEEIQKGHKEEEKEEEVREGGRGGDDRYSRLHLLTRSNFHHLLASPKRPFSPNPVPVAAIRRLLSFPSWRMSQITQQKPTKHLRVLQ